MACRVEFKETTGQRQEAARTLSAMLNGQGGCVLFGVRDRASIHRVALGAPGASDRRDHSSPNAEGFARL